MMKTLWVYKIPFDMLVYSIMFTPKTLPEYEWIYTMLIFSSTQKMSILFNIFQGLFNQLDIKNYDLIPTSLLLQLEAGRNFETFIASTNGLKPFSSTDH